MKKLFTLFSMAALSVMSLTAQQIPNNGFEDDWTAMKCWAAGTYTEYGTTPAPWNVSNVGSPSVAKSNLAEKVEGYNSATALMMKNNRVMTKVIPGYFTLGQPWSTAKGISGSSPDGGSFGGYDFTYRPDAVSFMYKSTGTGQPTVVAYNWKGTWTQADVPSNIVTTGSPKTVDMVDRDRNILGMQTSQGGAVTSTDGAELIAVINTRLEAETADWTACELPFDYKSDATPEKINLIFAAEDYFTTSPAYPNTLTVDDVKLVYYSRLKDVTVGGTPVAGFKSTVYDYDLRSQELPEASAIGFELLTQSGDSKATVSVDKDNCQVLITVRHNDSACTDFDGKAEHVYVLNFNGAPATGKTVVSEKTYNGTVTILANADLGMDENFDRAGKVTITTYSDGTCTFMLPDFALGDTEEERIGDIVVNNVKMTTAADGTVTYDGVTNGLKLSLGGAEIVANVTVEGSTDAAGKAAMKIHVVWLPDPENDPEGEAGIPIEVEFNGNSEGGETPEPTDATTYNGTVTILANADLGMDENFDRAGKVTITAHEDGTCTFMLPDFALGDTEDERIGDIVVNNVKMTRGADGTVTYDGVTKGLKLSLGGAEIVANVTVEGTTDAAGNAAMKIHVVWLPDPENDPEGEYGIPIEVEFNGKAATTPIQVVEVDNSNCPVEYYNIQGMRVNGDNLTHGIYIRRQGTDVKKILVK